MPDPKRPLEVLDSPTKLARSYTAGTGKERNMAMQAMKDLALAEASSWDLDNLVGYVCHGLVVAMKESGRWGEGKLREFLDEEYAGHFTCSDCGESADGWTEGCEGCDPAKTDS